MELHVSVELDQMLDSMLGIERRLLYERIGQSLPPCFRFNPLKGGIDQQKELFRRQGFRFAPVQGLEGAYRLIHQPVPVGKSLSHVLGHIYVQDAASMIPALALDSKPNETVLDMCAAPGSKTTLLAGRMENRGVVVANDSSRRRSQTLSGNLFRMGICNVAVLNGFGQQYGNSYFETFDRILLDPPCSALGTLHKSPEVLNWWSLRRSLHLASIQKSLLAAALKALRVGGTLVYSTCTLTPQENEAVIDAALQQFPVELEAIPAGALIARPGLQEYQGRRFSAQLRRALRICPVENECEGFFVARLRKVESFGAPRFRKNCRRLPAGIFAGSEHPTSREIETVMGRFGIDQDQILKEFSFRGEETIEFASREMVDFPFLERPVNVGVPYLKRASAGLRWSTAGSQWAASRASKRVLELTEMQDLERFVNRQRVDLPISQQGQILVKMGEMGIGYGVARPDGLRSRFPKGERGVGPVVSRLCDDSS